MIKVKVPRNKANFGFTFRYYSESKGNPVECRIISNGEILSNGVATTYYSDIYNKRFGRKLALEYALRSAKFSKEVRALFWKAYLEKCLL